jgi:C4-dicarboxylate transporter
MNTPEEKKDPALTGEIRERLVGYIVGALGLVAGLAWNDAIKSTIEYFYKVDGGGIAIKFIYALLITLLIVVVSFYVVKWAGKK